MNPDKLHKAVAKLLEEEAFEAEQNAQEHLFSKNERTAFRLGFYRGARCDPLRASGAVWEKAAGAIKNSTAPQHPLRVVACPTCGGSGRMPAEIGLDRKCLTCEGSGKIMARNFK